MKNFLEKVEKKGQQAENDKTERVTGQGRRTREEIAKWNQMTALRFRQGGDFRHPQPPFGLPQGKWNQCSGVAVVTAKMKHAENMNAPHGSSTDFLFSVLQGVGTKFCNTTAC